MVQIMRFSSLIQSGFVLASLAAIASCALMPTERPGTPGVIDEFTQADTAVPVLTLTLAGESIDDVTTRESDIFWSVSKPLASGTLTLTRTGGQADPDSPHTCTWVGDALNAGAHDHFQLDDTANGCQEAVALVGGAIYTLALEGVDVAGNAAETVSQPEVVFAAMRMVVSPIEVGNGPWGAAFDSTNQRMYVSNRSDDTVSIIDTETNTVTGTVRVGDQPLVLAFDSVHHQIYVPNYASHNVSVISTANNTVIATVPVGNGPASTVFDPVHQRVYVSNWNSATVSVIDTANNTVIDTIPVGNHPGDATVDSTHNRVYVPNHGSDTVSVIDTATNSVITTIPVGDGSRGAAFDTSNNRVYVTNRNDDTVSVIDTATNAVITTIPVGDIPVGIVFNSTNRRIYVTNENDKTVSVIDPTTNIVVEDIAVGTKPRFPAFDSANNRIYVPNYGSNTVSVIDARVPPKLTVTSPMSSEVINDVVTPASDIAWSVDKALASGSLTLTRTAGSIDPSSPHTCEFVGRALHVGSHANFQLDNTTHSCREAVTLANGATYTLNFSGVDAEEVAANPITRAHVVFDARILATVVVDSQPAFRPAFNLGLTSPVAIPTVYITNADSNTVSVIELATNTVIDTVAVGSRPVSAAFDPVHQRVYVSNYGSNTVSVIDTQTNTVTTTVSVGGGPVPPAYDTANRRVYVPNHISNDVSVINTDTNTVIATVPVGTRPINATYDPIHHRVYVTNRDSDDVSVISTTSNIVIAIIPVGDRPHEGAFDSAHDRVYVPNLDSDDVSVIDTATNTVVAAVPVNDAPGSIAFDSANNHIYVAHRGSDNVSVIDTASNTVIATIPVGDRPHGAGFDPTNNRIYVTNLGSNTVTVIDAGTPVTITVTSPTASSTINDVSTRASDITWSVDEPLRSGSLTLTRTGGMADSNSPHTCTFTDSALSTENHPYFSLSDTVHGCTQAVTLVDGAVYTFTLAGEDVTGAAATPVMITHVTFDSMALTVALTSSSGNTGTTVNATTLHFTATFSESVTGFTVGDITVTGSANNNLPMASNFMMHSGAMYTFDVVRGDSDGTVEVTIPGGVATDPPNGNHNATSNTYRLTIDTGPPMLIVASPASSSTINDVSTSVSGISWSVDKALASGSLTLTRTGGTADSNSPHTCAFVGDALDTGDHYHFQLDDTTNSCTRAVTLVNGAVYTLTFAGQDVHGRNGTPVIRTDVIFINPERVIATVYIAPLCIMKLLAIGKLLLAEPVTVISPTVNPVTDSLKVAVKCRVVALTVVPVLPLEEVKATVRAMLSKVTWVIITGVAAAPVTSSPAKVKV